MTCYAVIDTNVLVSALLSSHEDAATVRVVDKLFTGEVTPIFSSEILAEYHDVLHRPKFRFPGGLIDDLLLAIESFGEAIVPSPTGEILPDMKDLPFYEVVAEKRTSQDAYLVTGNRKHFPAAPFIVTAAEFLMLLEGQS